MKKGKLSKIAGALLIALAIIAIVPTSASAHCDTMDGPVISDAKKAIETNNLNYALKWVLPDGDQELTEAFELAMAVRGLSPEAQELADKYFYDNFVRIHRAGEGAPYTGVKPYGTPMEEVVIAADKSIEVGNLSPLKELVPAAIMPELQERLDKVLATIDFDVDDVNAGREHIEAYVQFFHLAEEGDKHGEEHGESQEAETSEGVHEDADASDNAHDEVDKSKDNEDVEASVEAHNEAVKSTTPWIPWGLAGLFFMTTLIAIFKKHFKI